MIMMCHSGINRISEVEMIELLNDWSRIYEREADDIYNSGSYRYAVPQYKFICQNSDGSWTACDNETGDAWTEDFLTEKYARRWLEGDYGYTEELQLEEKLNFSKHQARKVIARCKPGTTVKEFLNLCSNVEFWFNEVQSSNILNTCFEVLSKEVIE